MTEEALRWVKMHDNTFDKKVLDNFIADYFVDHLDWPVVLTHPRTYLTVRAEMRGYFGNTINTTYGRGTSWGDLKVVPVRGIEEWTFVARPNEAL